MLREQPSGLISGDVLECDAFEAFGCAEIFPSVGVAGVKRGADEITGRRHRIIMFALNEGELFALLNLEFSFRGGGFGEDFQKDFQARLQVGAEEFK